MIIKKRLDKNGVSPLISATLIIGFTITLGVVIFGWAFGFISKEVEESGKQSSKAISCETDVEIEVNHVCYNEEYTVKGELRKWLSFTVINQKNSDIAGFSVNVQYKSGASENLKDTPVSDLSPLEAKAVFSTDYEGDISKVIIIPKIRVKGGAVVDCVNKKVALASEVVKC